MSRSALSDIKYERIADCFRSDKIRIASFLSGLKNKPLNALILRRKFEKLFSKPRKLEEKGKRVFITYKDTTLL